MLLSSYSYQSCWSTIMIRIKRFWGFILLSVTVLSGQVFALSVRSRTGNLWRRLSSNKTPPPSSSTTPAPNGDSSASVPFGYSQVFGNQNQAPYVPAGLSAAEYDRIRQKEATAAAKKDYGAWGPRFAKGGRPDGDWLLLPQLWTAGIPQNALRNNANGSDPAQRSRWYLLIRRWFPAFFLSFLAVDIVLVGVQLTHAGQMTVRAAIWQSLKLLLRGKQFLMQTHWAIMLSKLGASLALLVPMQRGLDAWAEHTQWGRIRMISLSTFGAVLGLVAYALMIVGVRKVFV